MKNNETEFAVQLKVGMRIEKACFPIQSKM